MPTTLDPASMATAAPAPCASDAKTGTITANVVGAGVGDEVWFNKGDNHYYAAASGSNLAPNALFPARTVPTTAPPLTAQGAATLDVIDALSETLDQRVPTLNVPAVVAPDTNPHPAGSAHSVAAFSGTNHVFVPIAANNAVPNCLTGCRHHLWERCPGPESTDKLAKPNDLHTPLSLKTMGFVRFRIAQHVQAMRHEGLRGSAP